MRNVAVLFVLILAISSAQDWVARYSTGQYQHDDARALVVDGQGNSYVVGYAQGIGVLKYSPNGETLWTRRYTRTGFTNFGGMATALTPSGKLMVVASIRKDTLNGFCLLRYEPTGALIWDTVFWHSRSSEPVSTSTAFIALGQLGAIYVTGVARSDTTGDDIVTCKFNLNGGLVWARYKDGQHHHSDMVRGLALDADENALVAASPMDGSDHCNLGVVKYDSAGGQAWMYLHRSNSNFWSGANGVAVQDGLTYVIGWRSEGVGARASLVIRLSESGDTVWTRTDSTEGFAAVIDTGSNVFVVGCGYAANRTLTIRAWKYSPSGQMLWRRDYYGSDTAETYGTFACLTRDQGVCACGYRASHIQRMQFVAARYSAAGLALWSTFSDSTDPNICDPAAAALDPWDNVVMTGRYDYLQIGQDDFVTMKFRASGAIEEPSAVPPATASDIRVTPSVVHNGCRISVPGSAHGVSIADAAGRRVRTLACPTRSQGCSAIVTWDACDEHGQRVADGVYFVTLESSGVRSVRAQYTGNMLLSGHR